MLARGGGYLFVLALPAALARAPVVLIPGLGGSVIDAELDGAAAPHFWCSTDSDWYTTWLQLDQVRAWARRSSFCQC